MLDRAEHEAMAAEGSQLEEIDVTYVAEDGTMDLTAPYRATATFRFRGPAPPPPALDPSLPLGAPRPPEKVGSSACFRIIGTDVVTISHECAGVGSSMKGSSPHPRCTPAQVWAVARSRGAPQRAVAHLVYELKLGYAENESPMWSFEIHDTSYQFTIMESECEGK